MEGFASFVYMIIVMGLGVIYSSKADAMNTELKEIRARIDAGEANPDLYSTAKKSAEYDLKVWAWGLGIFFIMVSVAMIPVLQ